MRDIHTARETLEYVSEMSLGGAKVGRFESNPHVFRKDNVLEHIGRMARAAAAVLPLLRAEFADEPEVLEALWLLPVVVTLHDDEEILQGADITTFQKAHDIENDKEIELVKAHLASCNLHSSQQEFLLNAFATFRNRDKATPALCLVGYIAKVLDNLIGNQLVIEDELGMVQPDSVLFCRDYIRKFKGKVQYKGRVCETTDALIEAQEQQMVEIRLHLQSEKEIERLAKFHATRLGGAVSEEKLAQHIRAQLSVSLDTHQYNKDRVGVPVWEYEGSMIPNQS